MKRIGLISYIFILVSLLPFYGVLATDISSTETQIQNNGDYVRKHFLQLMKKPFIEDTKNQTKRKILIIGDSHAQDFLNAIVENNYLENSQISTRYIPTRCQIYLGHHHENHWLDSDKQLCKKSDSLELAKIQISQADIIILAAFWRKWAAESLFSTVTNLKLKPAQKLFIIGRRSFRKVKSKQIEGLSRENLSSYLNPVDTNQMEINHIMRDTLDKATFIDAHQIICGDESSCPAFTDELQLISFDGGHLSPAGAKFFGRELFTKSQLKLLLKTEH